MAELSAPPEGYATLLTELKAKIRLAQVRAALAVNRELLGLYWQLGQAILTRQAQAGWGAQVIPRLSQDLRSEFPDLCQWRRLIDQFRRTKNDHPLSGHVDFTSWLVGFRPTSALGKSPDFFFSRSRYDSPLMFRTWL